MSTMTTGGAGSEFDKLIELASFVQQPEYLDRVKELRELEASSKDAIEKATAATAEAKAASASLVQQQQKLASDTEAFHAERDAHNTDMARREAAVQANLDRFTKLQKQTTADSEALDRRQAQWEESWLEKQRQIAARETAVQSGEQDLARQRRAFETRVAATTRAWNG